ncbi:MAG: DUF5329 family protein [Pseudomonadota bacterium]
MKALLVVAAFAVGAAGAAQAATPAAVRNEITALLARLESSGCRFNRNGDWHGGAEAKGHLLRKLDAIDGKAAVTSTERFIELAASRSSSSGREYQVQCGSAAPQPSAAWLAAQLRVLRSTASPDTAR